MGKGFVPRSCCAVMKEMLVDIPVDESTAQLIKELNEVHDDAKYKAPEDATPWRKAMSSLQKHIPIPTQWWHYRILSIFTMRSEEDFKRHITEDQTKYN